MPHQCARVRDRDVTPHAQDRTARRAGRTWSRTNYKYEQENGTITVACRSRTLSRISDDRSRVESRDGDPAVIGDALRHRGRTGDGAIFDRAPGVEPGGFISLLVSLGVVRTCGRHSGVSGSPHTLTGHDHRGRGSQHAPQGLVRRAAPPISGSCRTSCGAKCLGGLIAAQVGVPQTSLRHRRTQSSPDCGAPLEVEDRRAIPRVALCLRPRKDVPEAQRLITRTRHNRLPVGRHGQVEHAQRVASERCYLAHRRVAPNHNLVLRVAMR